MPPIPDDAIIALLDPDMIFVRCFAIFTINHDFGGGVIGFCRMLLCNRPLTASIKGNDNNIFFNRKIVDSDILDEVTSGHPVGQTYGLGAPWTNDNHQKFNRGKICGEGSPCLAVTNRFGEEHYSVGPPYIAHKDDMVRIAASWTKLVPRYVLVH
jgi:hypothetical protein